MSDSDKKRLLIVDDETDFLEVFRLRLEDEFEVIAEEDPRDALKRFPEESFDLIISDYRMPALNGKEFLRQLREMGVTAPVFFLSGFLNLNTVKELINQGASCLFTKPLDFDDLKANIYRYIGGGASGQAAEDEEDGAEGAEADTPFRPGKDFLPLLTRDTRDEAKLVREIGLAMDWSRPAGGLLEAVAGDDWSGTEEALPSLRAYLEHRREELLATLWQLHGGEIEKLAKEEKISARHWEHFAASRGWGEGK